MTGRSRTASRAVRAIALGAAVTATVALTNSTASGAFSASTGSASNSVGAAASFCTASPTTLYSAGDAWTDEAAPADNHQYDLDLHVRSSSAGDRRTWVRFTLPSVPAHCGVAQARLYLYNRAPTGSRFIDVYRGDPAGFQWTAANITWSNQPTGLGPAATNAATTATAGWQQWVVTGHVDEQYTDGNNGFVLRDRTEGSATDRQQLYYDRQNVTYYPYLVLTWG